MPQKKIPVNAHSSSTWLPKPPAHTVCIGDAIPQGQTQKVKQNEETDVNKFQMKEQDGILEKKNLN